MHLQAFVGTCVIFLTMYSVIGGNIKDSSYMKSNNPNDPYRKPEDDLEEGQFERLEFLDVRHAYDFGALQRKKRSLPTFILKMLAKQGVEAVKFLQSGAKKVKTQSSGQWLYAKHGDFDTAYWDFQRVADRASMKARHDPRTNTSSDLKGRTLNIICTMMMYKESSLHNTSCSEDNDIIAGRAGDRGLVFLTRNPEFMDNPTIDVHDLFNQQKQLGTIVYVKAKKDM